MKTRERNAGESCKVCIYFSDFTDTEEADECNGYCTADFVKGRLDANPYGGHWTNDKQWCQEFEAGDPIWVREDPASGGRRP